MFSDLEISVFMDELEEKIQVLSDNLLVLEQEDGDKGTVALQEIFRAAHTIKGSSAIMGYDKMSRLTHEMESLLDRLRKREMQVTPELINALFQSLDALRSLKEEITGGKSNLDVEKIIGLLGGAAKAPEALPSLEPVKGPDFFFDWDLYVDVLREAELKGYQAYQLKVEIDRESQMRSVRAYLIFEVLEQNGEIIASQPAAEDIQSGNFSGDLNLLFLTKEDSYKVKNLLMTISEVVSADVVPVNTEDAERPKVSSELRALAGAPGDNPPLEAKAEQDYKAGKTVRVDVQKLDSLMNLVGELVIDRTRLNRFAEVFASNLGTGELADTLNEISNHLGQVSNDLQDQIMKARMLPVAQVFNRFPRMVRDLAQKLEKEVDFVVEGKETELDRNVIEVIGDPLIHLIRNALDHGIEPPEERRARGKTDKGRLLLKASYQESHIIITVEDDGRGIDLDKLREKALKLNLLSPDALEKMSEGDLLELIFRPGFSTAQEVSDLSGRGVGMDVVKNQIEQINGTVDVFTKPGQGSRFVIKLPLTLAIIRTLMVAMGEEVYAFPLVNVMETIRIKRDEIKYIRNDEVIVVRKKILPLFRLSRFFQLQLEESEHMYVVVLGFGEKRLGVVVDRLLGEEEIVIKSLGNYLGQVKGLAGATILGDGKVALIVDVKGIVKEYGAIEVANAG